VFFALVIALHTLEFPIVFNLSFFDFFTVSWGTFFGFISLLFLQFVLLSFVIHSLINVLSKYIAYTFRKFEKGLMFSGIVLANCGITYFISLNIIF